MKTIVLSLLFVFSLSLFANSVFDAKFGGTLYLSEKFTSLYKEKGDLLIEATSLDGKKVIARMKYKNPIFPQAFVLTPKNSVPPGMPLKRPFLLRASLKIGNETIKGSLSTKDLSGKGRYDVSLKLNQKATKP